MKNAIKNARPHPKVPPQNGIITERDVICHFYTFSKTEKKQTLSLFSLSRTGLPFFYILRDFHVLRTPISLFHLLINLMIIFVHIVCLAGECPKALQRAWIGNACKHLQERMGKGGGGGTLRCAMAFDGLRRPLKF